MSTQHPALMHASGSVEHLAKHWVDPLINAIYNARRGNLIQYVVEDESIPVLVVWPRTFEERFFDVKINSDAPRSLIDWPSLCQGFEKPEAPYLRLDVSLAELSLRHPPDFLRFPTAAAYGRKPCTVAEGIDFLRQRSWPLLGGKVYVPGSQSKEGCAPLFYVVDNAIVLALADKESLETSERRILTMTCQTRLFVP